MLGKSNNYFLKWWFNGDLPRYKVKNHLRQSQVYTISVQDNFMNIYPLPYISQQRLHDNLGCFQPFPRLQPFSHQDMFTSFLGDPGSLSLMTKHLHLVGRGLLLGFKENIHLKFLGHLNGSHQNFERAEVLRFYRTPSFNLPRTCGGEESWKKVTSRFPLIAWYVFLFPFRWEGNPISPRLPS